MLSVGDQKYPEFYRNSIHQSDVIPNRNEYIHDDLINSSHTVGTESMLESTPVFEQLEAMIRKTS